MSCRFKYETDYAYYVCQAKGYKRLVEVGGICSETPECDYCEQYNSTPKTDEEIQAFEAWDKENSRQIEEYSSRLFGY